MKNIRAKALDDRLIALSLALAEFRDCLTLLSLALKDYQFEKDLSLRRNAEYTTNLLLTGLMTSDGADRSGNPDAPPSGQR